MPKLTETSLPPVSPPGSRRPNPGQRFATVDLERHTGQESIGHREQYGIRNIVRGSDSPYRIAGGDVPEVIPLAVVAKGVPSARIDYSRRDGVDSDRRQFDGQPAGKKVDSAIG